MVRQRNDMAFGRKAPDLGFTLRYRFATNINELTTIVNPDLIPEGVIDAEDIIEGIEKQVDELVEKEYLTYEHQPSDPSFRGKLYEAFYIMPKSKIFIRKYFSGLEELVANRDLYEATVEHIKTKPEVKKHLKDLRTKLVNKAQDEIIEILVSSIKKYAPAGIAMIVQLVARGN